MRKLVIVFVIAQTYGNLLPVRNVTSTDSVPRIVIGGAGCVCKCGGSKSPPREDYQYSPGIGYHKLHTRAKNWNDARKICIDEGGHLAIINSAAEASILLELFVSGTDIQGTVNREWAFLGIHDFFKEGEWTTVLGEPLARTGYDHWLTNEPNNIKDNEHCGGFGKQEGLLDLVCNHNYVFFCEIPDAR